MWNVERLSFYRHAPLSLLIAYCDLPLSYDEILGRKIETANRPKGGTRVRETKVTVEAATTTAGV